MDKKKVILDIDNSTGIPAADVDDGLALALALASPEIDLLGVTTCAGNCRTFQSTENTLRMLEVAGATSVPVAAGRESPLMQDVSASFEYLEQRTARFSDFWAEMPPLPAVTTSAISRPAHEFIIETVKEHPGEVTIVKEGSLTNLGMALLVAPEIAPLVKEVVHMGGDILPWWEGQTEGSLDNDAELWRHVLRMNTEFDPEATVIVIESGIPFTFVTSRVSGHVLLRPEDVESIAAVGTPFHDFLADVVRPWVRWQVDYRKRQGAPMWDPLTLAAVIDPSFCTFVTLHCDSEKFLRWEYPWLTTGRNSPLVRVTADVDKSRFEAFLLERLTRRWGLTD